MISIHNFQAKHLTLQANRVADTGTWLLTDQKFNTWLEGETGNSTLWFYGKGIYVFELAYIISWIWEKYAGVNNSLVDGH